jgi:hypothetical protein
MGFFFIGLLIISICFVVLSNRGRAGWETIRISTGAKKRRSTDISGEAAALPPELKFPVETLTQLGFSRLGELQVAVPGGGAVRSRIYISVEKRIIAELAETGNLAVFYSVFPDNAVVETGHPIGENFDARDFRSHTVVGGLEQAYRHQVEQVEDFASGHGAPRVVATMAEYLDLEAMYRGRHVARKMRRHTRLALLEVAALAFGVLALLAAIVYWLGTDKSTVDPMIIITFLLTAVLAPVALAAFFIPFIGDWGDRRDWKRK